MGVLKTLKGIGKKGLQYGKKLGKKVTSSEFLSSAHRGLGKFNKFAIPILAAGGVLPVVGGVSSGLAKGLGAAQTGLGVASKLAGLKEAMTPSMGRSMGNSMSVENFHTPNVGALQSAGADMSDMMGKALSSATGGLSKITKDDVLAMMSNRGGALKNRIGNRQGGISAGPAVKRRRNVPTRQF